MSQTKYTEVNIGDEVIVFEYTNTAPKMFGKVVRISDHFVEIEIKANYFGLYKKWFSKANIEVIKD